MFKLIIIIGFIALCYFLWSNHIKIKWRTLLSKGFGVNNNKYGVYCYCGKQGSSKTFSVVEFLLENKDKKIYANLETLTGVDYTYIDSFEDLLKIENDTDDNIIIFYDEIFTALAKGDKMSKKVLSFLSQMRKRKIIFITTAQEWLEINITLRRYVRYQIDCSIRTIFNRSFSIKVFHDGEQLHWDNLTNDYVAPIISTTISKMNIKTANSYDTYETIKTSNN